MDDLHSFSIRSLSFHPFTFCLFFFVDTTHQPRHTSAPTLTMGKSDEKQTKMRAHKATDSDSKHNNMPSFDAATFEATDNDGGLHHSNWRDHFRQLCEFKVQFGHCLVPNLYSINPKLGRWVMNQRARYKKITKEKSTSMEAERIRALDGIGFDWGTQKTCSASIWRARFQQFCEFKEAFGHCHLVRSKYPAYPQLGRWISTQRRHYKLYQEGKSSPMSPERIRELESVEFKWKRNYVV